MTINKITSQVYGTRHAQNRGILRWEGGEDRGNSPPPQKKKKIPNSLLPSQNLKIAKFWVGGAFPPKWNMNIIINIKLVSGKPYNLEYKNG